jgi:hypothetical protein
MVVNFFHPEEEGAIFDRMDSTYCLRTAWHASSLERRESKSLASAGDKEGQMLANDGHVSWEHL